MSIIICKYCNNRIDTDYNAGHEEECESNPENLEEEETCGAMDRF